MTNRDGGVRCTGQERAQIRMFVCPVQRTPNGIMSQLALILQRRIERVAQPVADEREGQNRKGREEARAKQQV